MKKKQGLIALGALSAALAACSGETLPSDDRSGDGPPGTNAGAPGAGTGGTGTGPIPGAGNGMGGAASPTAGNASAGSTSAIPLPTGNCMPGIPVTTQIPKLLNRQYEAVLRDLLGVTGLTPDDLPGDFTGPMTATAWQTYRKTAAKVAAQVMAGANKSMFIGCDPAAAGCLRTTIETFGRKAFRRKLRPEEVESFESLGNTTPKGTPAQVAEAILETFLISPSFLLVPELATETEGMEPDGVTPRFKLSSEEVAAKLSFLLWGSIPDAPLNLAADNNMLQTAEQIRGQAVRMLQDRAKAGPFIASFHREWAQMNNSSGHWWNVDHDPALFPTYKPEAKESYKAELDAFFEEVAYANGSFQDLLLSNTSFVNKDNAHIYGLDPAQYGDALTKVTLEGRPGFLTRAGFLSSYSNYGASSPILRGAFIAVELLALPVNMPDPEAIKQTVAGDFQTQRKYVEALTEAPGTACAGCHSIINPAGYVLEKYDAIGRVQTTDPRGGAIDASVTTATVSFGVDAAGAAVKKEIASPEQLMQELAKMPAAQERYAKAWVSYAYGRDMNAYDQCVVDATKVKLANGGYTILSLLADLAQTDSFRLRVRGAL
ncbi:MAG TPA: DUF1592 domain-containing protein [Polyangiaceae bacterium]